MSDAAQPVDASEGADDSQPPAPPSEQRYGVPLTHSLGDDVLHVDAAGYPKLIRALHDDGFVLLIDLAGVDYLTFAGSRQVPEGVELGRFEVVLQLLDPAARRRVRIRCQVPAADPVLPSVWETYPAAEAPEREVFDMFGITFTGHPDLTRILMPEDWIGHPLRKDYDSGRIPVQFKDAPAGR